MKSNYDLKQSTILQWENEMLIAKIMKLEKQIGELELKIREQNRELKNIKLQTCQ